MTGLKRIQIDQRHFRMPGQNTNKDLLMNPIEKIEDPFIRKAKEALYIKKFKTLLKRLKCDRL